MFARAKISRGEEEEEEEDSLGREERKKGGRGEEGAGAIKYHDDRLAALSKHAMPRITGKYVCASLGDTPNTWKQARPIYGAALAVQPSSQIATVKGE